MGLLTTYSKYNRAVSSDSVTGYSKSKVSGTWTYVTDAGNYTYHEAWECRRFRNKTYRYVGMDYETAKECAEAANEYYTRSVRSSVWSKSAGTFLHDAGGFVLMANIQIVNRAGRMYDVQIDVHEEDALLQLSVLDVKGVFAVENSRSYDTNDAAFE